MIKTFFTKPFWLVALCIVLMMGSASAVSAGEIKKFEPLNPAAWENFGWDVAISDDLAMVGAPNDDDLGRDSGSAYIFSRDLGGADNWGLVKIIMANDGTDGDKFGSSVSISGDTAVVGAHYNAGNGSAYVFSRNQGGVDNWGQVAKLTASDGAAGEKFGIAVSLSGDTAIVGASYNDDFGRRSGSAYVFSRNEGGVDNWGEVKKILPEDGGSSYDYFGEDVSISGDSAVVGVKYDDDNGSASGSAYVFSRDQGGANNWGQVKKITADDGAAGDEFGFGVSISGDLISVGSYKDDDNGDDSGSAYVFSRNQGGLDNWGQVKKITADDGEAGDLFGNAVSISGDGLLVGSRLDDDLGSNSGSAYVYARDMGGLGNWGQAEKLLASDGASNNYVGVRVSLSGDTALVSGRSAGLYGKAYLFGDVIPDPCDTAQKGDLGCDGGDLSMDDYKDLRALIGTLEGDNDWRASGDMNDDGKIWYDDLRLFIRALRKQ